MSKQIITGATKRGERYYCDGCGADISVQGSITTTMHADGVEFYVWGYSCNKCKNTITVKTERTQEDKEYWK